MGNGLHALVQGDELVCLRSGHRKYGRADLRRTAPCSMAGAVARGAAIFLTSVHFGKLYIRACRAYTVVLLAY